MRDKPFNGLVGRWKVLCGEFEEGTHLWGVLIWLLVIKNNRLILQKRVERGRCDFWLSLREKNREERKKGFLVRPWTKESKLGAVLHQKQLHFVRIEGLKPIPSGREHSWRFLLQVLEDILKSSWRPALEDEFQQAKERSGEFVSHPVELGTRRTS